MGATAGKETTPLFTLCISGITIVLGEGSNTVYTRYLEVKVHPKVLLSQSTYKFSGPRIFTLRYKFEVTGVETFIKIGNMS